MFATLDPTIRMLELPSRRRILLSDTVGFIRRLPTTLVKAFRATLEEVTQAAMVLHVVDLSSPHRREQMREVDRILGELDAAEKPQILVLNKLDRTGLEMARAILEAERTAGDRAAVVAISAQKGIGLDELSAAIEAALPDDPLAIENYLIPHEAGDKLSFLYEHARVIEREDCEEGVRLTAEAAESVRKRLEEFAVTR
jgi:GTP-binding protein HflX